MRKNRSLNNSAGKVESVLLCKKKKSRYRPYTFKRKQKTKNGPQTNIKWKTIKILKKIQENTILIIGLMMLQIYNSKCKICKRKKIVRLY